MIDIKELKQHIEQNTIVNNLIVYKCPKGSEFIPHQYINEFCNKNNIEVVLIDDVINLPKSNIFISTTNSLYVMFVESLSEDLLNYSNNSDNVWIICNKINKKLTEYFNDNIVEVPKLVDWQIKDFISSRCAELNDNQINELFDYYKNDLFRLDNELIKIELMGCNKYDYIKSQLYVDVSNYNIFDIVNSIIKRDKVRVSNIYKNIDCIDVDPFGLLTLLINNFRKVIDIQLAKNPTAESTGMSSKQFWAVKNYSCGFYSRDELIFIYQFLTDIDYKIKSGLLNSSMIINYIICKILSL